MKRLLVVLSVFVLASLALPSAFAYCEDCPDGITCIAMDGGARFCEFFPDYCVGVGTCPTAAASSFRAEYHVAAVHVIEPAARPLPQPQKQPKAAPVLTAAK